VLFEPASATLISADALWENGFGVVFPELEGEGLIESLAPALVIPGHGAVFSDVDKAIAVARERLNGFLANPAKHTRHAAKVLLKFKLLEVQSLPYAAFVAWVQATPYFRMMFDRHLSGPDFGLWIDELVAELVRSGAAIREGLVIRNAG
jgi:glyoxylase-like metal-dependent hydrolase (beta-lactamase superfamily II)